MQEEGDDVDGGGALGHSTARPSSTTHLVSFETVETVETVGETAAREYPCTAATDANTTTVNIKHDTERSAEPVDAADGSRTPITSRRMCHGPAESATRSAQICELSIMNHVGGESGVVECVGGGAALPRLVHAARRVAGTVTGTVADAVAGTVADAVAGAVAPME